MTYPTLQSAVAAIIRKHGTLGATAKATGIDKAHLSRMRSGKKDASDETLVALGLERVTRYRTRKGS